MKKLLKAITVTLFIGLFYVAYAEAFSFNENPKEKLPESKQNPLQNMREDIVFKFLRKNEALASLVTIWLKDNENLEEKLAELPYRSLYHKLVDEMEILIDRERRKFEKISKKGSLLSQEEIADLMERLFSAKNMEDVLVAYETRGLLKNVPTLVYMFEMHFGKALDVQKPIEKLVPEFNFLEFNVNGRTDFFSMGLIGKSVKRFWCYLQNNQGDFCSIFLPYSKLSVSNSGLTENEFNDLVKGVYENELEEYKHFVSTNKDILDEISKLANQKFIIKTTAKKGRRADEKEYCISSEDHEIKSLLEIMPYIRSCHGEKDPAKVSKKDL